MLSMREWLARRREQRVARLIVQSVRYDDHRASEQLAKMGKEMVPHLVHNFVEETTALQAQLKMANADSVRLCEAAGLASSGKFFTDFPFLMGIIQACCHKDQKAS